MIKSNLISTRWMIHKLKNNYTTGVKVLSPTSVFPAWWSGNSRRRLQRTWLGRPVVFDCKNSTGLGETEYLLLEGTYKV